MNFYEVWWGVHYYRKLSTPVVIMAKQGLNIAYLAFPQKYSISRYS
jgi:hypothetical protein